MACFIAPLVQAIVTTACKKSAAPDSFIGRHISSLEKMLWGGTLMLIVDHIINGEVIFRFPFFTALEQAGGGLVMLREILTVGVPMSLALTLAWVVFGVIKDRKISQQIK